MEKGRQLLHELPLLSFVASDVRKLVVESGARRPPHALQRPGHLLHPLAHSRLLGAQSADVADRVGGRAALQAAAARTAFAR